VPPSSSACHADRSVPPALATSEVGLVGALRSGIAATAGAPCAGSDLSHDWVGAAGTTPLASPCALPSRSVRRCKLTCAAGVPVHRRRDHDPTSDLSAVPPDRPAIPSDRPAHQRKVQLEQSLDIGAQCQPGPYRPDRSPVHSGVRFRSAPSGSARRVPLSPLGRVGEAKARVGGGTYSGSPLERAVLATRLRRDRSAGE
jgi:hypothetical protein